MQQPRNPLVSVVIPTFDRARYICAAIDSVLSQTYDDFEIIVVDDGSKDDTLEVLERYGGDITVIAQANAGQCAATNKGITAARGELIALLDSDDLWLPEKLEKQVALYQQDPTVGLIGGSCTYVDEDGNEILSPTLAPASVPKEHLEIFTALPGSTSNALIPDAVLEEIGLFDEQFTASQDRELWIRIARRYEVVAVPEITAAIRVHSEFRPNRDIERIRRFRTIINLGIEDGKTRRKAFAWMWYTFWQQDPRFAAAKPLYYLIRSFLAYPGRILPGNRRLQPVLERLLPESVYGYLHRALVRRK